VRQAKVREVTLPKARAIAAYQDRRESLMQPGAKQGGKGLGPETTGFTGAGHRGANDAWGHCHCVEQQAVVRSQSES